MSLQVRYFGGLVEYTGREEEERESVSTVGDLESALVAQYGSQIVPALAISSFLVDGLATTDRHTSLECASAVDLLPPFAGG